MMAEKRHSYVAMMVTCADAVGSDSQFQTFNSSLHSTTHRLPTVSIEEDPSCIFRGHLVLVSWLVPAEVRFNRSSQMMQHYTRTASQQTETKCLLRLWSMTILVSEVTDPPEYSSPGLLGVDTGYVFPSAGH